MALICDTDPCLPPLPSSSLPSSALPALETLESSLGPGDTELRTQIPGVPLPNVFISFIIRWGKMNLWTAENVLIDTIKIFVFIPMQL